MRRLSFASATLLCLVATSHAVDPKSAELLKELELIVPHLEPPDTKTAELIRLHVSCGSAEPAKALLKTITNNSSMRLTALGYMANYFASVGKLDEISPWRVKAQSSENAVICGAIVNSYVAKKDIKGITAAAEKYNERDDKLGYASFVKGCTARAHALMGDVANAKLAIDSIKADDKTDTKFFASVDVVRILTAAKKTNDAKYFAKAAREELGTKFTRPPDTRLMKYITSAFLMVGDQAGLEDLKIMWKYSTYDLMEVTARTQLQMGLLQDAEATYSKAGYSISTPFYLELATLTAQRNKPKAQTILSNLFTASSVASLDTSYCRAFGTALAKTSSIENAVKWAKALTTIEQKYEAFVGILEAHPDYKPLPTYEYMLGSRGIP